MTSIGSSAFYGCYSLKNITIPSGVVDIIGNPFCGWHGELHNESKNFIYEDQVLFSKDRTTIIAYRAKETNYIIPDSVTTIGERAFASCYYMTSIIIPKSVTTIGEGAFAGCSMTSIAIPDSVTTIGESAFFECTSLISIDISNSVTSLGGSAFGLCTSLRNIAIPDSVTTIGESAFYECTSIFLIV